MMDVIGPICLLVGVLGFGLSILLRFSYQEKEIKELRQRIDIFTHGTNQFGVSIQDCLGRLNLRIEVLEGIGAPVDEVVSAITGAAEGLAAAVAAEVGAIAEPDDPTPRPTRRLRGNGA